MNFLSVFNNTAIRIPLLQRDYVQGSKESVISPFLDSLLDSEQLSDLNYIYGYTDEEGYFIPVDGQQRLTTLWLLYLYVASKEYENTKTFQIRLTFLSREYAQDFCDVLKDHLHEVLARISEKASLDETIRNQYWFIDSWYQNATVRNMLRTLKYIHRKCAGVNACELWKQLNSEDCRITFAFLDMKDDGLDDDIYIKMNGRGRPLSVYENLKSWMDEKIRSVIAQRGKKESADWCRQWLKNIDNKWTRLFWENRNLAQEHPEEIDDEQLYYFCNLLILYWMKHIDNLTCHIEQIKNNNPYLYEELLAMFPKLNENDEVKEVVGCLFDSLQKSGIPTLIWIERLRLMPFAFLKFAYNALNKLAKLSSLINDEKFEWYIGGQPSSNKKLYELSMCEGSYGRTLPLLYSVLLIDSIDGAKDWLRVCRNLILNTEIGKDKLPDILCTLEQFYKATKEENIYSLLAEQEKINGLLKAFDRHQVEEESQKAKFPPAFRSQMEKMENTRFFSGRIGVLFRLLGNKEVSLEDFVYTSKIMMNIFDGSEGGLRSSYDDREHLFRRTLMSVPPHFYGLYIRKYWSFCNDMNEWRSLLNNKDSQIDSLAHFVVKICLPAVRGMSDANINAVILNSMRNAIKPIDEEYTKLLEQENPKDKFYLHFVHHVGVWDYMKTSKCVWHEADDHGLGILLKTSNGNNSNKMELRTYCLYLDYCRSSIHEKMKEDWEGWNCEIYPKEETCLYFDIRNKINKRTIAIDVFHNRTKEDDYNLNLFVRTTDEEDNSIKLGDIEQYAKVNTEAFMPVIKELDLDVKINSAGRYTLRNALSRKDMILLLGRLLKTIKLSIEMKQEANT